MSLLRNMALVGIVLIVLVFTIDLLSKHLLYEEPDLRVFNEDYCMELLSQHVSVEGLDFKKQEGKDVSWMLANKTWNQSIWQLSYSIVNDKIQVCQVRRISENSYLDAPRYDCGNYEVAFETEETENHLLLAKETRTPISNRLLIEYVNPNQPDIFENAKTRAENEVSDCELIP